MWRVTQLSRSVPCLSLAARRHFLLGKFGGEFLPEFREGHFVVHIDAIPGTSLEESRRLGAQVSTELLALDHVRTVPEQIGRAASAEDPWGPAARRVSHQHQPRPRRGREKGKGRHSQGARRLPRHGVRHRHFSGRSYRRDDHWRGRRGRGQRVRRRPGRPRHPGGGGPACAHGNPWACGCANQVPSRLPADDRAAPP